VCDRGAAVNRGTDWTDRMEPLGAMISWGGAIGPMNCGGGGGPPG